MSIHHNGGMNRDMVKYPPDILIIHTDTAVAYGVSNARIHQILVGMIPRPGVERKAAPQLKVYYGVYNICGKYRVIMKK